MRRLDPVRRVLLVVLVIFSLVFFAPDPATANMTCWPAGTMVWVDGYTYCATDGTNCLYCEVVDKG
jgi:hypothetical protein